MFKKIKWFLFYRSVIHKNRLLLLNNHNIKIDWVNRMYKTYTFTKEDLEEIKIYGNNYVNTLLEKDKIKIENTFLDLKIHQFVALIELEKLNDRQIGFAFRYRYFDTAKIFNVFIWSVILLLLIFGFYLVDLGLKSLYFGSITTLIIFLVSRLFRINRVEK